MNWTYCNVTADDGDVGAEVPLAIGLTFHHLGLLLCIIFGGFAVALSLFLMFMHATHYSEPLEQRYILRILFMVPIYSIVSFLSFAFWRHSVDLEVLRDCYEAFAIASFFALMCHYVAPTLHDQKERFREIQPRKWLWPVTWGKFQLFKTPRSGLTWFNIIWISVYQYCFVRVACTILAVVTQALGRYCISSESPLFAHVWVSAIEAAAVTVAMYCLIQFYVQLKDELAPYKPGMKLVAIKAVIFLSFWQTFILSILTSDTLNLINPGSHVAQPDLTIGIPALCICIEMALFAIMHIFVYPWKPYDINSPAGMQLANQTGAKRDRYYGGFLGVKAFLDAFNPIDILRAVGRGFRWVFVGRKRRFTDPSYQNRGIDGHGSATEDGSGTKLSGLSNLGTGKVGKYSKIDDGDDGDDVPLTSRGARPAYIQEPRYPQDPFDERLQDQPPHYPGAASPFDDDEFTPPALTPTRPYSPYEAYRAQRQSRHQTEQSVGDIGNMQSPPPMPLVGHGRPEGDGFFQPTPLHAGVQGIPAPIRPAAGDQTQDKQHNPWAYGNPL